MLQTILYISFLLNAQLFAIFSHKLKIYQFSLILKTIGEQSLFVCASRQ